MGRRTGILAAVLVACVVGASAAWAAGLSGTYTGTEKPYQRLGGSHGVSLKISHGKFSSLVVAAGKVSCATSVSVPRLSGFPAAPVQTETVSGSGKHLYDIGTTFDATSVRGPWHVSHATFESPGRIYVSLSLSSLDGGKSFSGSQTGLEIQWSGRPSGLPASSGNGCFARGGLKLGRK